MPTITITREDVLRGKTLQPGWYDVTVKAVNEEVSSKGDSTNYIVDFTVDSPETLAGTPLRVYFNEKAIGRAIPFVNACGAKIDESSIKPNESTSIDLEKTVNKKIKAYVSNDTYEGRTINKVEDFRPRS